MTDTVSMKAPYVDPGDIPTAVYPMGEVRYDVDEAGVAHGVDEKYVEALTGVGWTVVTDGPDPITPPERRPPSDFVSPIPSESVSSGTVVDEEAPNDGVNT